MSAILMAFGFAVQPDKNDDKKFITGWTRGRDMDDVMEKIQLRFVGVPKERIKIHTSGETWESFIKDEYSLYSGGD